MIKVKLLFVLFLFSVVGWGQTTLLNENFGTTAVLPTGWVSSNTTNGWSASTASVSSGYAGVSGGAHGFFNGPGTSGLTHTFTYANNLSTVGYTNITIIWGGRGTTAFTGNVVVEWSSNGTIWNTVVYTNVNNNSNWALVNSGVAISLPVGAEGSSNLRFRWSAASINGNYRIDDFIVKGNPTSPTITLSPITLSAITYVLGSGPSANQTFTASGSNLTNDIELNAPTNYEISTISGSGFGNTLTLTPSAGVINATTIYVRLKSGLAIATFNGEIITATSAGATNQSVTCNGRVTAASVSDDLCDNATNLVVNAAATSGSLTGSTFSVPFTNNDVWYSFTPTCTGNHTITVTAFTGDVNIELFSGSCPTTVPPLDSSAESDSTETISAPLTSGTTYYLRVLAFDVTAETSAFTAQIVSNSVLTLANAGSPATGNINAGTANAVIMGFATTPSCATSYSITNVTLSKSTVSTVTTADISNFRIFYDANENGRIDGGEASVSGTGLALAPTMAFTLTGQTGITAMRKYLLVGDVALAAVNGHKIKINLTPNTNLTAVLSPSGTVIGTALGTTQTITPPICTSAVIASFTPASGPVGTEVTITASSGSLNGATATFNEVMATVVSSSATQLVVKVPNGAFTGNLVVTDSQPCNATIPFTVINNDINACQGEGNSFTDLIISEVYDSIGGNVWHMELFNPTNAAINLDAADANYKLERFANIGSATPSRTVDLSGIVLPGAVYLADLGTITDPSCPKTYDFTDYAQGINDLDAIKLTKEGIVVDIVNCPNETGYTITRNTTAVGPAPIFNGADWNTNGTESCTDLGLFNATLNMAPTITAQPSLGLSCSSTSAVISVTATEGFAGGAPLAYQWYGVAPGVSTWTELTDAGVYSGTTSNVLNISSLTGLNNYQYYCQVREDDASCYQATIAVKITAGITTAWYGTGWSNGMPNIATDVIIDGAYSTENGSFEARSLVINTAATVTISGNTFIKLEYGLTNNGTFTIDDSGSLIQVCDNAVNFGSITVKRNTQPVKRYDYTYWSSPVASQTLYNLSPNTLYDKFYGYDSDAGWVLHYNGAHTMKNGKGYIVRAPQNFDINSTAVYEASFIGVPNNGLVEPAIVGGVDKWNLVGNPYPSAIDANAFLGHPSNTAVVEGTIYLWTHNSPPSLIPGDATYNYTSSDYAVYNSTGGVATRAALSPGLNRSTPNGYIASGQAFFVKGVSNGKVTFNNSMRQIAGVPIDNSQFFKLSGTSKSKSKTARAVEKHRVWLNMTNAQGAFKQTLVGYVTGATNEYDSAFDGESFDGNQYVDFYSVNENKNLTIQGRGLPFDSNDQVPLGYRSNITGNFTIAIDQSDGLFSSQNVYLEDKILAVIHNLKESSYNFTTGKGVFNDRFVLRYTDKTLGIPDFDPQQNKILASVKNKQIKINSFAETIDKVTIFDELGRQVYQKSKVDGNEFLITDFVSGHQILLVKIGLQNGNAVTKKIIY